MFNLLKEFNIKNTEYKNLALLPGFNIPDKKNNLILLNQSYKNNNDVLRDCIFNKLINNVHEKTNNLKKTKKKYNKNLNIKTKKIKKQKTKI
tara:strand:- start:484 stop:759 length:276 start_codon:yes stop_codon:yes gene_type:complete